MKTSTAYDLSQFAPVTKREPRVQVVRTNKKKKNSKRSFKIKAIVYLLVLSLLMSGTVFSRLQLTELQGAVNKQAKELTEIESENTYLSYQLDSLVSLRNAEDYAVNELGLVKMDSNQIEYVSLRHANTIESNQTKTGNSFLSFINLVIEFFGG